MAWCLVKNTDNFTFYIYDRVLQRPFQLIPSIILRRINYAVKKRR